MPLESYRIWLGRGFRLVVTFVQVRGNIVSFAVVLVAPTSAGERDIARYDTAHGTPHRDLLGLRKGLHRKDWFPTVTANEVFSAAIADFKANHENYLSLFEKN